MGAKRWCAAAFAVAALGVAGCGSSSDDGGSDTAAARPATNVTAPKAAETVRFGPVEAGSGRGLKLGYVSAAESVTFNHLVTVGVQRAARAAGAELVTCDSQADAQKALDCVKSFKTQGVDGYLLYQLAADSSQQICAAGPQVPVIGVSIEQEPCQRAFLAVDDTAVGFAAGRDLGEFFKQRFDCDYDAYVSLEYSPAGRSNTDRMQGYADGFASVCGEIHGKRKLDVATTDAARQQFNDVLTTLPGRDKIVTVGIADFVVQGALAAAKNAGRADDVYVSAQGADPSAHCDIKNDPQWINDAAYLPERWGEIGIPNLIRLIRGERVQADLNVPFQIVDSETIEDAYPALKC
ncbi:substrate-binding domain-containing protein [Conexibacter sp. JD483]|uniref:sugar ABC transporter substrate-binding protein n=1 Tax=unclassified Conexibacter TaxID=2627773 RepID=UPI002718FE58|nr:MULTISPECIES: substrate-binding domain-containing protein [unclassified Conexibacter]MDO8186519.1 substrate-binding domain-containing protein [Conexibacter sp. CPCC 205706]MDO8200088.1 substrate-binding domain-containing protein [Conexibacter sp. CPCC 205762]MDR9372186.1 substrate-binding domain-containing protein [Conexibacter sp. JD483]